MYRRLKEIPYHLGTLSTLTTRGQPQNVSFGFLREEVTVQTGLDFNPLGPRESLVFVAGVKFGP